MTKQEGLVFNIQRYSIQDGPGIRSTVFLKGCPLGCLWCSNPESQNSFPEVGHRDSLCTKCGRCLDVCEPGAISISEAGIRIDRIKCNNCGQCVDACYCEALTLLGKQMSVEDVLQELERDVSYYRNSGGGITASGGEPLSQPDFVATLFKRCHERGIHTTLDTAGYASPTTIEKVIEHTDLVLFDIKSMDSAVHSKATGVSNELILENANTLARRGVHMIIRVPLIPGWNDSQENMRAIANFTLRLNGVEEVDLLPYHRLGTSKYKMLDRPYRLSEVLPPSEEHIQNLMEIIRSFGLRCEQVV